MPKIISETEKEHIIEITRLAVRSGLANGDYQNIDIKLKSIMRDRLASQDYAGQIYTLKEFIVYLRRRIEVPGGRLGIIALINVGRVKGVPGLLLDSANAIWGTLFSAKADAGKLRDLLLT